MAVRKRNRDPGSPGSSATHRTPARRVFTPVAPERRAAIERRSRVGFEGVYRRAPRGTDRLVPRRSNMLLPHTEGSTDEKFRRACLALGSKTRSLRAVPKTFAAARDGSSE